MVSAQDSELDALVARLADGDRSVFSEVFRRLWPAALRLCTSMLKNEADAADAAQQAMEKILTRAADYDPSRSALPWALGIAAWECRTLRRKRFRRREIGADSVDRLANHTEQEEDFARRELVRVALDAIGELSELDRETLVATFWEEAASTRGATVRKRRERALVHLRRTLKRLYGIS